MDFQARLHCLVLDYHQIVDRLGALPFRDDELPQGEKARHDALPPLRRHCEDLKRHVVVKSQAQVVLVGRGGRQELHELEAAKGRLLDGVAAFLADFVQAVLVHLDEAVAENESRFLVKDADPLAEADALGHGFLSWPVHEGQACPEVEILELELFEPLEAQLREVVPDAGDEAEDERGRREGEAFDYLTFTDDEHLLV